MSKKFLSRKLSNYSKNDVQPIVNISVAAALEIFHATGTISAKSLKERQLILAVVF
jgi:hypothetical protein